MHTVQPVAVASSVIVTGSVVFYLFTTMSTAVSPFLVCARSCSSMLAKTVREDAMCKANRAPGGLKVRSSRLFCRCDSPVRQDYTTARSPDTGVGKSYQPFGGEVPFRQALLIGLTVDVDRAPHLVDETVYPVELGARCFRSLTR